jgi:hypothetical protein
MRDFTQVVRFACGIWHATLTADWLPFAEVRGGPILIAIAAVLPVRWDDWIAALRRPNTPPS